MKTAIVGAGALGCGFLYPLFERPVLLDKYAHARPDRFMSRWILPKSNEWFEIEPDTVFSIDSGGGGTALLGASLIVTALPPGALLEIATTFDVLYNTQRIILCCENCYDPAGFLRKRLPHLTNTRFVNAIAHVGAFWHAEGEVWCDEGWLEVESDIGVDHPLIRQSETHYDMAYLRKFYLHSAPHAVIAYNGVALGCESVPEATRAGDYEPLWEALRESLPGMADFLEGEVGRFTNADFPDPVARVARDPARKLRTRERLPSLLEMVLDTPAQGLVVDAVRTATQIGRETDPTVAGWLHDVRERLFYEQYCGLSDRAVEAVLCES